jgi:hypothetical protein
VRGDGAVDDSQHPGHDFGIAGEQKEALVEITSAVDDLLASRNL